MKKNTCECTMRLIQSILVGILIFDSKWAMKESFESLLIIWDFILNSVSKNNRYLQFRKLYVLDTKTSRIL